MPKKLSYDDNGVNSESARLMRAPTKTIFGAQIRAARALLRWAATDLVRESGVSLATIHRAEAVDGKTALTFANASAIQRALEEAGVEFTNGDQPGVRLTKAAAARLAKKAAGLGAE